MNNKERAIKYFWRTLILFILVYVFVSLIAIYKTDFSSENPLQESKILKEAITLIFIKESSTIIKENLLKNKEAISENLKYEEDKILSSIDKHIDEVFEETINSNIDKFLDFHYSIIGSYTELGTMAFSDYDKFVSQMLLGDDFADKMNQATQNIEKEYVKSLKNHLDFIESVSTIGVDFELNSKALSHIKEDINANLLQQEVKLGVLGLAISAKIASVITAKIAAKSALKTGAKAGSKVVGSGSGAAFGASAGVLCGPGAIICSPIGAVFGAVVFWIATDFAINKSDEHFSREDLKKEIEDFINLTKIELKNNYISILNPKIEEISTSILENYEKTNIKERRKIKDLF